MALLVSPFVASLAHASEIWGELRLDGLGGSMTNVPVVDQVGETCYAYAAAQMFDAYRFSHGDYQIFQHTSGYAAAIENGVRRSRVSVDGGNHCNVVNTLAKNGGCDGATLPERGQNGERLGDLESYLIDIRSEFLTGASSASHAIDRVRRRLEAYGLPRPSRDEVQAALGATSEVHYLSQVLVAKACASRERIHFGEPRCLMMPAVAMPTSMLLDQIENALEGRGAQPVAISVCADVLKQGRRFNESGLGAAGNAAHLMGCVTHVVLVIGRRMNDDRLELLVRNSWGTGCSWASQEWECEGGNVWVDAEALAQTTNSYAYLY